jgi:TP901 family phage tail tape measure protein
MGAELRGLGASAQQASATAATGMDRIGKASQLAGTALLVGVGASLAIGAKAAIEFESAFAGVRKTVDASEAQFERLARGLRDLALEIPITVGELARIAELGGQLGLPAEAITEFTEVIAKLGVTTNLEIEEAASSLARFAKVMGTSTDDFDRLGSAVVDLGNNYATTEKEILTFATRLSGIGATVGATEGDVLGLATAFTALGEPAERGATAIQRAFISMLQAVQGGTDELRVFAEVAGLTAQEFANLFRRDPVEAFIQFEEGLGNIIDRGGDATGILKDLGLGSQRTIGLMLKGANSFEVLASAVELGNEAFAENIALNEEADKRFSTTESAVRLAGNAFKDLGIEIGQSALPAVASFAQILAAFVGVIAESIDDFKILGQIMIAVFAARVLRRMSIGLGRLSKAMFETGAASKFFGDQARRLGMLGAGLSTAVTAALAVFALVAAIKAIDRARAKQHAAAIDTLTDAVVGLKDGSMEATDAYLAFVEAAKQSEGIGDPTVDFEAPDVRQFIADVAEISTRRLIGLAISDQEEYARITGMVTERLESLADAQKAATPVSLFGRGTVAEIAAANLPEHLKNAGDNLERWRDILVEIEQQTQAVREEEALRQLEFQLDTGREIFPDADLKIGFEEANRFQGLLGPLSEETKETLADLVDETAQFGADFNEEWQDILDNFNESLFDWGAAWNEYETVQAISLAELTKSLSAFRTDQQRLTNALRFITESFGTDMVDLFLSLPADLQADLAATLATQGPEAFMSKLGEIQDTWAFMIGQALERSLLLAPAGAERAMAQWDEKFLALLTNDEIINAFAMGSDDWIDEMIKHFTGFEGSLSPLLQGEIDAMMTAAEIAIAETMPGVIDPNAFFSTMDQLERIRFFKDLGFSWAEAIALGFALFDLPNSFATETREGILRSILEADELLEAGSPSQVFFRMGQSVGEGFKLGIEHTQPQVDMALANMTRPTETGDMRPNINTTEIHSITPTIPLMTSPKTSSVPQSW